MYKGYQRTLVEPVNPFDINAYFFAEFFWEYGDAFKDPRYQKVIEVFVNDPANQITDSFLLRVIIGLRFKPAPKRKQRSYLATCFPTGQKPVFY